MPKFAIGWSVRRTLLVWCILAILVPVFPLMALDQAEAQAARLQPDDVLDGRVRPTPGVSPWAPAEVPARASVPFDQLSEAPVGPALMHTVSCFSDNGRIDISMVNTESRQALYRVEFEGLSPRESTIAPGDVWRFPITGRPDRDFDVVIKRDGAVISDQTLTVSCDSQPAVTDAEVRVVSSCRAGNSSLLFQFANASPQPRGWVIEFEGVPNRSTSAAPWGQALRRVTGRQDGVYDVTIRGDGVVIDERTIRVACDEVAGPVELAGGRVLAQQAEPGRTLDGPTVALIGEPVMWEVSNGDSANWTRERYQPDGPICADRTTASPLSASFLWTPEPADAGEWVVCAYRQAPGQLPPMPPLVAFAAAFVRVVTAGDVGVLGYDDEANLVNMVHPLSGNWVVARTDVSMAAVGEPLHVHRVYNSRDGDVGGFGVGWSSNLTQSLIFDRSSDVWRLTHPDGRVEVFRADPDGVDDKYLGPGRFGATLLGQPTAAEVKIFYRGGSEILFTRTLGASTELTSIQDPSGNVTRYLYSGVRGGRDRQLEAIRDEESQRTLHLQWSKHELSGTDVITSIRVESPAEKGQEVAYTYEYGTKDSKPVLVRACDPRGSEVGNPACESYGWIVPAVDSNPQARRECDTTPGDIPLTRMCAIYDQQGRLVEDVTYKNLPVVEHRSHPAPGQANLTTFTPDPLRANTTDVTDPLGNEWSYSYRTQFGQISETLAPPIDGHRAKTVYEYYEDGNRERITTEIDIDDGEVETAITEFEYDDFGNLIETRRLAAGPNDENLVTRTYWEKAGDDELDGFRIQFQCSGSDDTHSTNLRPSNPTATPSPAATKYCVEYDYGDNNPFSPTEIITPIDDDTIATEERTYDSENGRLLTIRDVNDNVTTFDYDAVTWDLIEVVEPTQRTVTYGRNGWGQSTQVSETIAGETVRLQEVRYDKSGRMISRIGPATPSGPDDSVTELGERFEYDPQGRLAWSVAADLRRVPLLLNASRALIGFSNTAQVRRSEFSYDHLGRMIEQIRPDHTFQRTVFDAAGNSVETEVGATTNAAGRVQRYVYDAARRVEAECFNPPVGSVGCPTNLTATYEHDLGNRRTSETHYASAGVIRRTVRTDYDVADRVVRIELDHPEIELDGADNISAWTERRAEYEYDQFGRLDFLYEGDEDLARNPTGVRTTDYAYAEAWGDRVTSMSIAIADSLTNLEPGDREDGVDRDEGADLQTQSETYDYDVNGLVASHNVSRTGGTSFPGAPWTTTTTTREFAAGEPGDPIRGLKVTTETASSTVVEAFDQRGVRAYMINARGHQTDYSHDAARRLITTIRPGVVDRTPGGAPIRPVMQTRYNAFGDMVETTETTLSGTDSGRGTTSYGHDPMGRTVEKTYQEWTDPVTGITLEPVESWSYDPYGFITSHTNTRGYRTRYTYDELGHPKTETLPARALDGSPWGVYSFEYDWTGTLHREDPPDTAPTTYTYDGADRRVTSTMATDDGPFRRVFAYDSFGNVTTETSRARPAFVPLGEEDLSTRSTYNVVGDMLSSTVSYVGGIDDEVPAGTETVRYDYNHLGLQVRVSEDKFRWYSETGYNQLGYATGTTRYGARPTQDEAGSFQWGDIIIHDVHGNLTSRTSPQGRKTEWRYDELDRLIEVEEQRRNGTAITRFGYNAAGDLTTVRDARSNTTTHGYNPWGDRTRTVEPATERHPDEELRTFTWSYDEGGLVTRRDEPDQVAGAATTRILLSDYDELGRLISQGGERDGVTGKLADRVFRYETATLPASELGVPGGSQRIMYDERGRIDGATYTHLDATTDYDYDGHDRLTERLDPSAADSHRFGWHADGRLRFHNDPVSGETTNYSWEEVSRPGQPAESITDLHTRESTTHTTSYDIDTGRRIAETITGNGTTRYEATYQNADGSDAYDNDGNLLSVTIAVQDRPTETHDYTYDNANRLWTWTNTVEGNSAETVTYDYDNNGNRTRAVGGPDGTQTWTYDQRDRVLSSPDGTYVWSARGTLESTSTQDGITSYAFDNLNRLRTVATPGEATISYSYDALERIADRSGTFTYAGLDTDPAVAAGEHYGRSPNGTAMSVNPGGGNTSDAGILVHNHRGDITAVIDPLDGAVNYAATFDPWGNHFEPAGNPIDDTNQPGLGYQADWTDPDTGDTKTDTRWYHPGTASFRSRDIYAGTTTAPTSQNRFLYAHSNPNRYTDPTGLNVQVVEHIDTDSSAVDDQPGFTPAADPAPAQQPPPNSNVNDVADGPLAPNNAAEESPPTFVYDSTSTDPPQPKATQQINSSVIMEISEAYGSTIPNGMIGPAQPHRPINCYDNPGAAIICGGYDDLADQVNGFISLFTTNPLNTAKGIYQVANSCGPINPGLCIGFRTLQDAANDYTETNNDLGLLGVAGRATADLTTSFIGGGFFKRFIKLTNGATPDAPRGVVALDTNALINGLDSGNLGAVDAALGGRRPLVSPTAVDEFLAGGGSADELADFLTVRGGAVTADASPTSLASLQARLDAYNATASQSRVIRQNDFCITAAACEAGVPLMTNDQRLFRTLVALGIPVEGY